MAVTAQGRGHVPFFLYGDCVEYFVHVVQRGKRVGSLVFTRQSEHHTDAHKHVIKIVDCHLTIIPGQGHHQHQPVESAYPQDRILYTMDTYYYTFPFTCQI